MAPDPRRGTADAIGTMKLNIPTEPKTESKGPAMKTRVIVHRSLLRGTFYILAALSLIAYLLPAVTASPPYTFTPRRWEFESRPFLVLPAPFL